MVTGLDYGGFEALTFDCYGTLIDWEAGILAGIRPVLARRGVEPPDDELLEVYARSEAAAEAGPYLRYREILGRGLREVADHYGIEPDATEIASFADSVGDWPAFPDSTAALALLATRFRLGVITNCDDDLFARSAARLRTTFDWVVTAESVGGYKPDRAQLRSCLRAHRPSARADPARRAEPVPRPRPGETPRPGHGLDRSTPRPARVRGDAARGRATRRDVPGHGVVRGGRDGNDRLRVRRSVRGRRGPGPVRSARRARTRSP